MSAAKSTPPAAQARNAPHEKRRRVATIAVNEITTPVHSRSIAKVGPGRSLHLTSTGPHAQTNVASHTAAIPRRRSGSRSGIRPSSQRPPYAERAGLLGSIPMRENTGTAVAIALVATIGYTVWAGVHRDPHVAQPHDLRDRQMDRRARRPRQPAHGPAPDGRQRHPVRVVADARALSRSASRCATGSAGRRDAEQLALALDDTAPRHTRGVGAPPPAVLLDPDRQVEAGRHRIVGEHVVDRSGRHQPSRRAAARRASSSAGSPRGGGSRARSSRRCPRPRHRAEQALARRQIEPGRRLVEQQELVPAEERARDQHPLTLAERARLERPVGERRAADRAPAAGAPRPARRRRTSATTVTSVAVAPRAARCRAPCVDPRSRSADAVRHVPDPSPQPCARRSAPSRSPEDVHGARRGLPPGPHQRERASSCRSRSGRAAPTARPSPIVEVERPEDRAVRRSRTLGAGQHGPRAVTAPPGRRATRAARAPCRPRRTTGTGRAAA